MDLNIQRRASRDTRLHDVRRRSALGALTLATAAALISPALLARALGATEASVLPVARVSQVAGSDRASTAVALSRSTYLPPVEVAYVANGARGLIPPVVAENAPLLYLDGDAGPSLATSRELERLEPRRIVVLGGFDAVSERVRRGLEQDGVDVCRIDGSTSALLAVSLSEKVFSDGARVAYVVDARDTDAAVVASAVAANAGGPVLLTEANELSVQTMAELIRLEPRKIFVVGVAAERDEVIEKLRTVTGAVHRLGGANLHTTAAAVRSEADADRNVVYLLRPPTTDGTVADAMAAASVAGKRNATVLWLDDEVANTLDEVANTLHVLDVLQPQRMVLVGSTAGLSPSTREALEEVEHRPED